LPPGLSSEHSCWVRFLIGPLAEALCLHARPAWNARTSTLAPAAAGFAEDTREGAGERYDRTGSEDQHCIDNSDSIFDLCGELRHAREQNKRSDAVQQTDVGERLRCRSTNSGSNYINFFSKIWGRYTHGAP
jgi:hypothetical protein